MVASRKKICLLIASALPGWRSHRPEDWLKSMPEIRMIADLEPVFVFNENSANLAPKIWLKLAQEIDRRFGQYHGFVVIHGVDNLLYTAGALNFLLANLTKPIIFTGSYAAGDLGDFKRLGFKANLINAIQTASFDFSEIGLMFGNRLLRASQATLVGGESLNVFTAPASGVLGRIDFSIRLFERLIRQNQGRTKFFKQLENNLEIIHLTPALDLKNLAKNLTNRQAALVNAANYQSLPDDLMALFERAAKDLPIVVWSRNIKTPVIAPKNILVVNEMTWPTTLTKLMWALTQSRRPARVKNLMLKDLAGEIIYKI